MLDISLIGLEVKTGTKREHFHPYKKKKGRGGHQRQHAQKGYSINLCWHPSTWCNSPSFPTHRLVVEEDMAGAEDVATEATHQAQSSSNLLNVLPPPQPGIRPKTLSESPWDYPQGCAQLNGNKFLSASTLQERVKTPCVHTLQEREKTPFVQSFQEREKTPCVQSLQEKEKTPRVQSQSVFIPDQLFKLPSQELEFVPVGGRLRCGKSKKLTSQSCP